MRNRKQRPRKPNGEPEPYKLPAALAPIFNTDEPSPAILLGVLQQIFQPTKDIHTSAGLHEWMEIFCKEPKDWRRMTGAQFKKLLKTRKWWRVIRNALNAANPRSLPELPLLDNAGAILTNYIERKTKRVGVVINMGHLSPKQKLQMEEWQRHEEFMNRAHVWAHELTAYILERYLLERRAEVQEALAQIQEGKLLLNLLPKCKDFKKLVKALDLPK